MTGSNDWTPTVDELEGMDLVAFVASGDSDEDRGFRIADDDAADWAVRKIAEERAELARMEAMAAEQIARIQEKVEAARKRCESGTAYLTGKLAEYFNTVPHKATKTQETYRLLSGVLKMKRGGASMKQDDKVLLEHLKATGNGEFITVTEKPKWGEFKKRLQIVGDTVVDKETGEIVEGVQVIENPDVFTIDV